MRLADALEPPAAAVRQVHVAGGDGGESELARRPGENERLV